MGKNGSIAEEEMCCQMKLEKFLLIEIAEVQGVLTTVGVIKVNELVRSYKRQRSISEWGVSKHFTRAILDFVKLREVCGPPEGRSSWALTTMPCCWPALWARLGCPLWLLMWSLDMRVKRWWWGDKSLFCLQNSWSASILVLTYQNFLSSKGPTVNVHKCDCWCVMERGDRYLLYNERFDSNPFCVSVMVCSFHRHQTQIEMCRTFWQKWKALLRDIQEDLTKNGKHSIFWNGKTKWY